MKKLLLLAMCSSLAFCFFSCADSDDDDDDTSVQPIVITTPQSSANVLSGAYLGGLEPITLSVDLNADALTELEQGKDISEYFSATTSAARAAISESSIDSVTNFTATVCNATASALTFMLTGKLPAENCFLSFTANIPAAATATGAAAAINALALDVGPVSSTSTASLDLAAASAPSASAFAGKTFRGAGVNTEQGCEVTYFSFDADGTGISRTFVTYYGDDEAPYVEQKSSGSSYDGSGTVVITHGSDTSEEKLIELDGSYYLYDDTEPLNAEVANNLFTTYNMEDGSSLVLAEDGSISGIYVGEGDDSSEIKGTYSGSFVNNGGIITLYTTITITEGVPDDHFENEFTIEVLYDGQHLYQGMKLVEFTGIVPTETE